MSKALRMGFSREHRVKRAFVREAAIVGFLQNGFLLSFRPAIHASLKPLELVQHPLAVFILAEDEDAVLIRLGAGMPLELRNHCVVRRVGSSFVIRWFPDAMIKAQIHHHPLRKDIEKKGICLAGWPCSSNRARKHVPNRGIVC
jgi:hypothetical protein